MLIAHAPAGYLLTRLLSRTLFKGVVTPRRNNRFYQLMMVTGVAGAIIPDIDFFYHFFFDADRTPHHDYITHLPLFWAILWGVLYVIGRLRRSKTFIALSTAFCANVLLHLVFDTITGSIRWLYPVRTNGMNLFVVADVHVWWVQNYLYHWTFLLEVAITAMAMVVFLRVKETFSALTTFYRRHRMLQAAMIRIGVCTFGVGMVLFVGTLRFRSDSRIVHRVRQIRQAVVRMVFSS
jgi:inner membrane protein